MPNIRSIFNFDHPWLDFNLMISTAILGRHCEIGVAIGCMYQMAPRISDILVDLLKMDRHEKIIIAGLRISYVAMLGWQILQSRLKIAPDIDEKAMDPLHKSSEVASERPWLNRYLEGSSTVATYICSFSAPILVQAPLGFLHHLLPHISSTAFLGFLVWDFLNPFIPWRHVTMAITLPVYRAFIDPERRRIAQEKSSLSRGFLEIGQGKPMFEYQPLTSAGTIRLLGIKIEVSNQAKATCDLIEVDIDNPPSYEALSYRWDSTPLDQEFHLCIASDPGKHIPLTKNAYDALQALTPTAGLRYLWIDSICINQKDTVEKSHQILLMRKIYRSAQRVVVFLSHQSENLRTISFLNRIFYFYVDDGSQSGKRLNSVHKIMDRGFVPGREDIEAFQELLNNDFFSRVWIIQECVLAKNINVLIGNIPFPWMVLMSSLMLLRSEVNFNSATLYNKNGGFLQIKRNAMLLTGLAELRAHYLSQEPANSLVDLVIWNRFAQATDPRDKIYALLGLCPEDDVKAIEPSYEKNVETVYRDFVRHALQQPSYLSFSISGLAYDKVVLGSLNLPSWLPRFSQTSEILGTSRYHNRTYQAGSNLLPESDFVSDGQVLRIRGNFIDVIGNKSSDFDLVETARKFIEDPAIDVLTDHASRVIEMQYLFELHTPKDQSQFEERKKAFWRTILDDFAGPKIQGLPELSEGIPELEEFLAKVRSDGILQHIGAESIVQLSLKQIHEQSIAFQSPIIDTLLDMALLGRPFAVTEEKKLFASIPKGTEVGDIVVIFNGAPAPCILRPARDDACSYYLVGEAYVHGVMHGEAMMTGESSKWFDLR